MQKQENCQNKSDIWHITINEDSLAYADSEILHERRVAIHDLLDENSFRMKNDIENPYHLHITLHLGQIVLQIHGPICQKYKHEFNKAPPAGIGEQNKRKYFNSNGKHIKTYWVMLSLAPFKRIIKDYFQIYESYSNAVKNLSLQQIEAIDITRRSIHNEASNMLRGHMQSKIDTDILTARRLFTLICTLKKNS